MGWNWRYAGSDGVFGTEWRADGTLHKDRYAGIYVYEQTYAVPGTRRHRTQIGFFGRLVTVLGEIPNQEAAMKEIFEALKPGGILSVTEIIFDPHFQRRETVLRLASQVGFREKEFFGKSLAYTLHVEKPSRVGATVPYEDDKVATTVESGIT